jgi:hypothetical protein
MSAARLFRWIWRFNAIVIAASAVLVLVIGSYAALQIFEEVTRVRHATALVNVAGDDEIEQTWRYGPIQAIRSTEVAVMPLQLSQSYGLGLASGKEAESTRNLLFINNQTGGRSWLFDSNGRLIAHYAFVPDDYRSENDMPPVSAAVYYVVKADTDHDGRMSLADRTAFGISRPDGSNYIEIVEADSVLGYLWRDPATMLVAYQNAGEAHLATVRLTDFTVLRMEQIEEPAHRP